MAKLVVWLLPKPEIRGSNQVIGKFYVLSAVTKWCKQNEYNKHLKFVIGQSPTKDSIEITFSYSPLWTFSNMKDVLPTQKCHKLLFKVRSAADTFLLNWQDRLLLANTHAVWPDWAIYCTLGNFSKPVATIILPKSPTFKALFVKVSKSFIFQGESFGNHFWATL